MLIRPSLVDEFVSLYNAFLSMNQCPDVEKALFGACHTIDDLLRVREEVNFPQLRGDDLIVKGAAYNRAQLRILFEHNADAHAKTILNHCAARDSVAKFISLMLQGVGSSYVQECMSARQYLVPREVTDRVIARHVIDYAGELTDWCNCDGVAIIFDEGEQRHVAGVLSTKLVRHVQVDSSDAFFGHGIIDNVPWEVYSTNTVAQVREVLLQTAQAHDLSIAIMQSNHAGARSYFIAEFLFYRKGQFLNTDAGIPAKPRGKFSDLSVPRDA